MITGRILSGGLQAPLLDDVFSIRQEVFVKEQGYAMETEKDENDQMAAHAIVYLDQKPVGTARLYLDQEAKWHIGRVAVLKAARGQGIGDLAMRMLLQAALDFGADAVYLGSQEHAVGFYERLGFVVYGDVYLDEGEPHRHMLAQADAIERLFRGCDGCKGCTPQ